MVVDLVDLLLEGLVLDSFRTLGICRDHFVDHLAQILRHCGNAKGKGEKDGKNAKTPALRFHGASLGKKFFFLVPSTD